MKIMRKIYLIAEFIFIFVILPILLTYFELYNSFLFFLWGFGLWAFITLKRDKSFDNKLLWNRESLSLENIRPIILRFMILGSMIAILTYFLEKDEFLKFPMEHTYLWLAVMILYPILSVYPQELIYRALQFHRYKFMLGENFLALFITSLTFGFVHMPALVLKVLPSH
jgi:hypothetical protein